MSRKFTVVLLMALSTLMITPAAAQAGAAVFPGGCCYYKGVVVRTVVPPAASPQEGRDNFYGVTNGVEGQKGIVGVAPGDADYHGGQWKFFEVIWNEGETPSLLTSEAAVLGAEDAGDVTVMRVPAKDFKCPIQR